MNINTKKECYTMTVSEAVDRSKTSPAMSKGSIKAAQKMISPSEEIIWAMTSNVYTDPVTGELSIQAYTKGMLAGVIVVTDQRILFVNNVLGRGTSKEVRLSDIRSIDSRSGNILECLRIVGTTNMIVTTNSSQNIQELRNAINEAIARKNTQMPAQTADDNALEASDIQQLQALKQLYDTGVITAEEFAAKKAQILNL
jgi:hypothetical protein